MITPTSSDLPKLSAPAQRALIAAEIFTLNDLAQHTEAEITALHGMGPNALAKLKHALHERRLQFTK